MIAALSLVLNLWPRAALVNSAWVAFLSFIGAAQDFASYQSDGMLLEAGFISLFFAPAGWQPGWGASDPPSRASRFLLVWLMFRIYFESGIAKILGRDTEWRDFTAMDQYYQNGPLPTWIAWYVHHLPHWFHASTAVLTLALELVLIFAVFLPRPWRIGLFFLITPWQIGIILTSNYAFLNYIVLVLGFLLLDDKFLVRLFPERLRGGTQAVPAPVDSPGIAPVVPKIKPSGWRPAVRLWVQAFFLTWIFRRNHCVTLFHGGTRRAYTHFPHCVRARAISHRKPIRIICGNDAQPLRNRISRFAGRPDVDALSISVQAAGRPRASADLRALPAAI